MSRHRAGAVALLAAAGTMAAWATAGAAPPSGGTDQDLQRAFQGTIVSTYPDGRQGRLWLNPDGSYKGRGRRGDLSGGRWNVKGAKICLHQKRPIWVPFAYCTALPSSSEWRAKAPTGEPISVRLVPGGRPS